MKEYVVDLTAVTSWPDFIAAFNEGFVRPVGGEWHGNLDAFNDYLSWPDEDQYRLVIRGWQACAAQVNRQPTCDQRPVLDVISEIFRDNPQAEVIMAEPVAPADGGRDRRL